MSRTLRLLAVLLAGGWLASAAAGDLQRTVGSADGTEVPVAVLPAPGDTLLVWLPTGLGFTGAETRFGRALAQRGVESWYADLLAARFLPVLSSSLDQIPGEDVAAVVAAARAATGKRVVLLCGGHGCLPALRGAVGGSPPDGLVLIYPSVYAAPPEPGSDPGYAPEAARLTVPVVVVQPELSTGRWHLDSLVEALARGGARVQQQVLPGVRDRFYDREDAMPRETAMAERLPEIIESALAMLRQANEQAGGTK